MLLSRWSTFRMLMLAIVAGFVFSTLPSATSAKEGGKPSHCVIYLEPAKAGLASTITNGPCVDTLADSIAIATKGRVKLPKTATPDEIDKALRVNDVSAAGVQASYVLSIEYLHSDFGGSTYSFTGPTGCDLSSYYINTINSSWNDQISSSRGYSNCNRVRHWEHTYLSGALLDCYGSCSGMGALNDKTSSLEWFY